MRWTPGGSSDDIEDRRGDDESGGGGGGFNFTPGHGIGLGGLVILGVLSLVFRTNLIGPFLGRGGGAASPGPSRSAPNPSRKAGEAKMVEFVKFTINDLQVFWAQDLPAESRVQYRKSKLVLFWDETQSACGTADSASGPFYCPGDEKVYLDLGFYAELKQKFGAPGEFAQAYVIAHEVGHHIQNLLGTERKVRTAQRGRPDHANMLSVAMELQADCYAGVWGHSAAQRGILETGDAEAGLNAAAAIGDDRLQKMATGHVMPEKFTHGSSAQRVEWFKRGLTDGKIGNCNTFAAMR